MLRLTLAAVLSAALCGTPTTRIVIAQSITPIDAEKDISPFDQPLEKPDTGNRNRQGKDTDQQDKSDNKASKDSKEQGRKNQKDKNSKTQPDANKDKKVPRDDDVRRIASLRLSGAIPEVNAQANPFGVQSPSLRDIIRRLDKAAQDDDIAAVLLELRSLVIGRGGVHELREAVRETRQAGKRVYASLEAATPAAYLVASACDEIRMPESGYMSLPGVRAEIGFYKRILEKLNVQADFLQVGDYKGAAEPMTRDSMSKEFREQYSVVIDDMYEQMVEIISQDRRLATQQVETIVDRGLFTASGAYEAGLIDAVAYDDEFSKVMRKNLQADEIQIVKDYGKKKMDTDFSGMMGLVKLMEVMMGADSSTRSSKTKKIAVINAIGAITTGKSQQSLFGVQSMGSDTIVKALRKANDDDSIQAIVLRVDSPGGSALASDLIWRQIGEIEKPVVASMGDVAASGGYYISMGCDKILAEPGTLTGSIGVVSGKLAIGKMFDKIGISTEVISRGANSGMFTSHDKFTPSERKVLQQLMDEVYGQFTQKAAAGRGMDLEKLLTLAGGRVWTGRQAAANGLVDRVGTLADAIATAQKLAGIDPEEELPIIELPKPKTLFEDMFGGADAMATRSLRSLVPQATLTQLQQLETLQELFAEPTVLMLPYTIEIH